MAVLCRKGQHQHQMIGLRQQLWLADIASLAISFQRGIKARAVVIDDLHAKAMGSAAGNGLADTAHAQNAQRCAVHLGARKQVVMPVFPQACTQIVLALANAPCGGHQQCKAKVCRSFCQHIGGVRALHASSRHRGHVEVVIAHRHIGNDLQLRADGQQRSVDGLRASGQHAVLALQLLGKFLCRPDHIVLIGLDFKVLLQALHHFGRNGAGNQNARLGIHACCLLDRVLSMPQGMNHSHVITASSGSRMQMDQTM